MRAIIEKPQAAGVRAPMIIRHNGRWRYAREHQVANLIRSLDRASDALQGARVRIRGDVVIEIEIRDEIVAAIGEAANLLHELRLSPNPPSTPAHSSRSD